MVVMLAPLEKRPSWLAEGHHGWPKAIMAGRRPSWLAKAIMAGRKPSWLAEGHHGWLKAIMAILAMFDQFTGASLT